MESTVREYLSEHPFFSGLSEDGLDVLAEHATARRIAAGEVLFRQGDPAQSFYLLKSGRVTVEIPALYGPALEIQNLGPEKVVGWSWLIAPFRWSFQARAIEDSDLYAFDGVALLSYCERDPRFGYGLLKRFAALMSERLEAARQKMMDEWNPPGYA